MDSTHDDEAQISTGEPTEEMFAVEEAVVETTDNEVVMSDIVATEIDIDGDGVADGFAVKSTEVREIDVNGDGSPDTIEITETVDDRVRHDGGRPFRCL